MCDSQQQYRVQQFQFNVPSAACALPCIASSGTVVVPMAFVPCMSTAVIRRTVAPWAAITVNSSLRVRSGFHRHVATTTAAQASPVCSSRSGTTAPSELCGMWKRLILLKSRKKDVTLAPPGSKPKKTLKYTGTILTQTYLQEPWHRVNRMQQYPAPLRRCRVPYRTPSISTATLPWFLGRRP